MTTMLVSTTAQKNEFLSRLSRIESGTGSSKSTLYVGVDGMVMASSKDSAKLKKQAAEVAAKPLGLFGAVMAVAVGILALGIVLYLRFSVAGAEGPLGNADMTAAINGGMALAMAIFAGYLLRMPMLKFVPICAVGVLLGVVGFHNLVHFYPTEFSNLFSPVWVDQVVTSTPANSIIWRGQTFVL